MGKARSPPPVPATRRGWDSEVRRRPGNFNPEGAMKNLHIAVVYNAYEGDQPELAEDRAGTADLETQIRHIARTLRRIGHGVTILPLALDLFAFQRKLRRICP